MDSINHISSMKLKFVYGYSGNFHSNLLWSPEAGYTVYATGMMLAVDDLMRDQKCFIEAHKSEISVLAKPSKKSFFEATCGV